MFCGRGAKDPCSVGSCSQFQDEGLSHSHLTKMHYTSVKVVEFYGLPGHLNSKTKMECGNSITVMSFPPTHFGHS